MSDAASGNAAWSHPSGALQADSTVYITTRPASPFLDKVAQSVTEHCTDSFAEQNLTDPFFGELNPSDDVHAPNISQNNASLDEAQGGSNADLQHMSTSDLQAYCKQGFGDFRAQDTDPAEQKAAALFHASSDSSWQQGSGIVINDAATAQQDMMEHASASLQAASTSGQWAIAASGPSDYAEPMDISLADAMETEASCMYPRV